MDLNYEDYSTRGISMPRVFFYTNIHLHIILPNINDDKCHVAIMTILTNNKSLTFLQLS